MNIHRAFFTIRPETLGKPFWLTNFVSMSFLAENLRVLRKQQGLTQAQFAEKIGSNRSAIGAYEEGRADPRLSTLTLMARYFGVTIDDLILTQMTTEGSRKKNHLDMPLRVLPVAVDGQKDNSSLLSLVPDRASAGYTGGFADAEFIEELPLLQLPFEELRHSQTHRVFQIDGDSMLPIPNGAYIIGAFVEQLERMRPGQCYILVTQTDGLVYKRMGPLNAAAGTVELISDNPQYEPYALELSEVREVWEAQGYICFDLPDQGAYTPDLAEMKTMLADLQASVRKMQ